MNFAKSPRRTLMIAAKIVLVGFVCLASAAQAAPRRGARNAGKTCDPQTTLRKLMGTSKSFGGPVARRSRRVRIVVPDATARLLRGTRTNLDDSAAAIQNDTSAAQADSDDYPVPSLTPLGLLARPFERQPGSPAFSPRSPRGPPSPV